MVVSWFKNDESFQRPKQVKQNGNHIRINITFKILSLEFSECAQCHKVMMYRLFKYYTTGIFVLIVILGHPHCLYAQIKYFPTVEESVVSMFALNNGTVFSRASAVVFSEKKMILANYHDFASATNIEIKCVDSAIVYDQVLAVDIEKDIIVFSKKTSTQPLVLANMDSVYVGNPVYIIYSNGNTLKHITALGKIMSIGSMDEPTSHLIQIDAAVLPDADGGAVVNEEGKLIGICKIIVTNGKNYVYAIPVMYFLRLENDKYKLTPGALQSQVYCFKANQALKENLFTEVNTQLNNAINADPNNYMAFNLFGKAFFNAGDYARAKENYDKSLQLQPRYIATYKNLADLYTAIKDYDNAILYYTKVLDIDSGNIMALYHLAKMYDEKTDFVKAKKYFHQLINLYPFLSAAHKELGNTFYHAVEYDSAVVSYKNAIQLDTNVRDAEVYNSLGEVYYARYEYDSAITYFVKSITINKNYIVPHYNMGNIYKDQNLYENAIICYRSALNIDPLYEKALNAMGNVLSSANRFPEAIDFYERTLRVNQANSEAYFNLGIGYIAIENYELAIKNLSRATIIDPAYTEAYYKLGSVYYIQDQFDSAIICFSKTVVLDPSNAKAYYNLGNGYYRTQDYDKSLECYNKTIELDPYNSKAYYNKGNILFIKGDNEGAIPCYEQSVKIDPFCANCYFNLGKLYLKTGQYEFAKNNLQKAIEINPQFSQAYSNLGKANVLENNSEEAIKNLRKSIDLGFKDADTYYYLGLAYGKGGKSDAALYNTQQAIKLNPGHVQAYLLLSLSYQQLGDKKNAVKYKKIYQDMVKNNEVSPQ